MLNKISEDEFFDCANQLIHVVSRTKPDLLPFVKGLLSIVEFVDSLEEVAASES